MRAFLVALLVVFLAGPAYAAPRHKALRIINRERVEVGCGRLRQAETKYLRSARSWSQYMARLGSIEHSELNVGEWALVGEVIGVSDNWRGIITALFDSPPHRAILLDCAYRKAALGSYFGEQVWLTGRFYA